MDPRERFNDSEESVRTAIEGLLAGVWTALPGIVVSFDPVAMTCEVQPAIKPKYRQQDGTLTDLTITVLTDCPVIFPAGGGYSLTFPVAHGDECLVVFSSRCIDAWWQQGGIQPQAELRMHDLSDGFAIMGIRSQPRVLDGGVSTTSAQLRTDDGTSYLELGTGYIKLKADNIYVEGASKVNVGANGTGIQYTPGLVTSYMDGVPTAHSGPTPPRIPE